LGDEGFTYKGEDDNLPLSSEVTFRRGRVSVTVIWDGRDRFVFTRLGLTPGYLPFRARGVGLGLLDSAGESALGLPLYETDPEPITSALTSQAALLRTKGASLLAGDSDAWADALRRQNQYWDTSR